MLQSDNSFGPSAYGLSLERDQAPTLAPQPASNAVPDDANLPESLSLLLSDADQKLGRLDGMFAVMPHQPLIYDCLVRREALTSARIEGTFSNFAELAHFEQIKDMSQYQTILVLNQVKALRHAMNSFRARRALSATLLREIYEVINSGELDEASKATEARRAQMAGSHVVAYEPPALRARNEAFVALFDAMNSAIKVGAGAQPMLLGCAQLFAQIPSIHPLFEQDGRMQRMLIPLLLTQNKILHTPLLSLSPVLLKYDKQSRQLLRAARVDGDINPWIEFFLQLVAEAAESTINTIISILHRLHADESTLMDSGMNRSVSMLVLERLREMLYTSPSRLSNAAGITLNSTDSVLKNMMDLGIVAEQPPRPGRMICYLPLLRLLEEGTVAK